MINIPKTFINDVGTKIETTLNTDLTGLSSATYYVKKGNGTTTTWACTVESVTTGIVYYNVVSGDLNVSGKYLIHTVLVYNDGSQYTSDIKNFKVYDKYMT